jgi:orotidine-5'-phosphate decarboxylase
MRGFGERLHEAVVERGRICVGLDPHPSLLTRWGLTDDVRGLAAFAGTVVEAVGDRVAVVKPQSAFFERFGAAGVGVLESTIRQLRSRGALVLLDVKRGDIGSTAQAYADAYLDAAAPMAVDAITASPFLGFGSLRPMVDTALRQGAGVFVLALTSNPEGAAVQRARTAAGSTVAGALLDEIAQVNEGVKPWGSIGAVIGATVGDVGYDLTRVNGPLLAPGLGAQGATVADLHRIFGDALGLVLPTWSREVLAEGPSLSAIRSAVDRLRSDVNRVFSGVD